jgi:putative addiction module component (TIGR02574 family)
MTVEQIIEETRGWPAHRVEELVTRLHHVLDPNLSETEIDRAWKEEIRRRVAAIEKGRVQLIPGEEVSARLRKIIGR